MFIVYTEGGAIKLLQDGLRSDKIIVVRNTIDMEEQRRLHAELLNRNPDRIRQAQELRAGSKILLYIGRLYKEKKVEELLMLVERLNSETLCHFLVEAVIIGGGPELPKLRRMAEKIQGVRFVGELYDQKAVAVFFRVASALVIPGAVGLAVNHAFSQGVPVITREHKYHGPEAEYIVSGYNGLIVPGDIHNFVRATAHFLNSPQDEERMAAGALETRERLTLEFMVKAFDLAVMRAMT
jgi:glycosyltransferase involved in cell wall biosynthesis